MNLKQNINGPAGIAIAVVVLGVFCFYMYTRFLKDPPPITPQEMLKNMTKGMQQQNEMRNQKGPRPPGPGAAAGAGAGGGG